jgi:hypothetical protein
MTQTPTSTDAFLNRFLTSIPPEVAATFTEAQLDAIKKELGTRAWNPQPVDLRLSVPVLDRKFFFVLLGGPERRSRDRLRVERRKHPILTFANTLVISAFIFMTITSAFGTAILVKRRTNMNVFPNLNFPDEAIVDFLCPGSLNKD